MTVRVSTDDRVVGNGMEWNGMEWWTGGVGGGGEMRKGG